MKIIKKNFILKRFYKFLKEENILEKYISNFTHIDSVEWRIERHEYETFALYFNERFDRRFPGLILFSFNWECSNEGYDFWSDIDEKWETEFKKIKKIFF